MPSGIVRSKKGMAEQYPDRIMFVLKTFAIS